MIIPALYAGPVMHHRFAPRVHHLEYSIFQILLDLDTLDQTIKPLKALGLNRFNWLGFYERDHGPVKGDTTAPLRERIIALLAPQGLYKATDKLFLLAMPRVLGFVFNPIALYFVQKAEGDLRAIVYQVNNTFGDRHCYVLPVRDDKRIRQAADKRLHVSPFMDMDMAYRFDVTPPEDRFSLHIQLEQVTGDRRDKMLTATFRAKREPLTDRVLMRYFFAMPLMTLKVVWGIHWEALKLWLKGLKYRPGPKQTPEPFSVGETSPSYSPGVPGEVDRCR
ncbi:DUF1365 domain-containing protein [Asticcacaulis sp. YBE204]|uniref:DUF1365 domain-containing protein n=1 Tax=Asticcacaulis sp. YBE204 TaxID=1282363 RepID=UPI0003C3D838|nr:DUF1365 domain-containing protein [Asticcacaulis sp. YBE204]ESQ80065.1 hypothetical protein AEYBE204_05460 [Asticcacaulis sp. YBE204]